MKKLILIALMLTLFTSVQAKELIFGTYPSNSPENIYKAFTVISDYLAKETGQDIKLVVTKDYSELSERVANGSVDIAWIASVNYVKLKKKVPTIKYLATYSEKSTATGKIIPYYQSYIITLKDSEIKDIKGLKDKMFAFVDKDSTSGYAYPKMMLNKLNINPDEYFAKVFFMKKHDRVIEALVNKSIVGGAVSDGTYVNAVKAYGNIFNIVMKSEPIPLDAVIVHGDLNRATADKIRTALLNVNENHEINKAIKDYLGWPAAGFISESDGFYDSLRNALGL